MNWSDFSIEELMLFAIAAPFFVGLFLATFDSSWWNQINSVSIEDGFWGSIIKIQEQMNEFNELARKKIGEIMIQNSPNQEDDWMVVISNSVFNEIWTRGKKVPE